MRRRRSTPPAPLRWDADPPPAGLQVAIPPARMALARGGRPLKRWRYMAVFCDALMLCAGSATVGPARSSWWAVWDRERGALAQRTRRGRGTVRFGAGGTLSVHDGDVVIELAVSEDAGVQTVNPHGAQYVWTRKQAARPARGRVAIAGRELTIDGLAVVDDTAGYHARVTEWWWSAGVGHDDDGAAVGWNVVSGVNDGAVASERSVWRAGHAQEVGPVVFAADMSSISFEEGGRLRFVEEAVRARREHVVIITSDYRQPFGRLTGSLPTVGRLHDGLGVVEHHIARW